MAAVAKHWLPIVLMALVLAGIGWLVWRQFFDVYHLATVQNGVLYRDGVRSMHAFELGVNKTRVKTVVCLVDDQEIVQSPFVEELQYCHDHQIEVVRLPVLLGGWPDGDQIASFLKIVNDPARQPVMVHCAQGVRRTGMMVAAYQMSVLGYDAGRAQSALQTFGHSERTVGDIKRFIAVYDPKSQHMTQQLPRSTE